LLFSDGVFQISCCGIKARSFAALEDRIGGAFAHQISLHGHLQYRYTTTARRFTVKLMAHLTRPICPVFHSSPDWSLYKTPAEEAPLLTMAIRHQKARFAVCLVLQHSHQSPPIGKLVHSSVRSLFHCRTISSTLTSTFCPLSTSFLPPSSFSTPQQHLDHDTTTLW
jgi:hypothetical protein